MLHIFEPVTKYFKIKKVRVYDGVFGLHCQVSVAILVACAIIVSAKEYFGKAIDCVSDDKDKDFVSTFCWVAGTYITENFQQTVGAQAASVGVTGDVFDQQNPAVPLRIYQRYYPWIVLFLFFQAITFLTPSYLWKIWEGGRLEQMCEDLRSVFVPEEWNIKRRDLLISYFSNNNKDIHMCYALKYFFCEFLNCAVCVQRVVLNAPTRVGRHGCIPIVLIVFLYRTKLLVESLILFFIYTPNIGGKIVQCLVQGHYYYSQFPSQNAKAPAGRENSYLILRTSAGAEEFYRCGNATPLYRAKWCGLFCGHEKEAKFEREEKEVWCQEKKNMSVS
ncbi:unnamed protein product [Hermetia illucens]|uniref:Innexin n=1 Tax=Hermetia illucens TaxID=343691 RepID=A0A7R8YQW0_HERIL|nr:unnamed protein product [Hermetia illucens]